MKKLFSSIPLVSVFSLLVQASVITWTGPSGSNWSNAANWTPAIVPGATDDVIFNSSGTVEMDVLPAVSPFIYVINSLQVTGNASVTLTRTQAGGGTRILQVKNTTTGGDGLRIDMGSELTINAANSAGTLNYTLDLAGAAGVNGQLSGHLFFTGSGAGTGDAHLNLYNNATGYASLTVKSTGVIKYFNNSGNTFSGTGVHLTMEAGAVYEINKNGGSLPPGNWDDHSIARITGATTNGSIIFSQTQYGNLEWDTPALSAITQLISALSPVTVISLYNLSVINTNGRELRLKTGAASASPAFDYTIRNNLDIGVGGILVITGINVVNAGAGARLHVKGSLGNAGILKSEGGAGTINDLEFNGSFAQDISSPGVLAGDRLSFIMNNPAGAGLLTPINLPGTAGAALQLLQGRIKTSGVNILTLADNSGYAGGSTDSFIEGPLQKAGDDPFLFPVGKGSIYAPIGINPVTAMAAGDVFRAEYFRLNPQATAGMNYESPPIDHISYVEYWLLEKIMGMASPVNVTLSITPFSFAKDINSLYPARYNPPDLQWKNAGIASRIPGSPAPPYITGTITSAPLSQFGEFTLASAEPASNNPLPIPIDGNPVFRIDADGRNEIKKLSIKGIYPNPVFGTATVWINLPVPGKIQLRLFNIAGKMICQWNQRLSNGTSNLTIPTNNLAPGVYLLSINALEMNRVLRFVKL